MMGRRIPINAASCAVTALARINRPATTAEVAKVAGYTTRRLRTVLAELERSGRVRAVPATFKTWALP